MGMYPKLEELRPVRIVNGRINSNQQEVVVCVCLEDLDWKPLSTNGDVVVKGVVDAGEVMPVIAIGVVAGTIRRQLALSAAASGRAAIRWAAKW